MYGIKFDGASVSLIDWPESTLPVGFSEIAKDKYFAFIAAQSDGKPIIKNQNGEAVVGEKPKKTAAEVWEAIKAERDHLTEYGGVQVDGRWFDTDARSVLRYKILADTAAAQSLPDNTVLRKDWRPMDVDANGQLDMTYGLLKRIIAAGVSQVLAIDDAAEEHKAALYASPDPAGYDFSANWPKTFVKAEHV